MNGSGTVPRRPLAGTRLETSVLGVTVDPLPMGGPSEDEALVRVLRRGLEAGLTTFDLARARWLPRAAKAVYAAVPHREARLVILVGLVPAGLSDVRRPPDLAPGRSPREPRSLEETDLDRTVRTLSRIGSVLVELPGPDEGLADAGRSLLEDWTADGTVAGTIRHWTPPAGTHAVDAEALPEPPISVELSLLETACIGPLSRRWPGRKGGAVARDPFAGGRLDGTRFAGAARLGPPTGRPTDVRVLHEEFAPVLRLGALTRDHRRTLAEAAVQYVLSWPWVSCALLPVPASGRWTEATAALNAPGLDEAELTAAGLRSSCE